MRRLMELVVLLAFEAVTKSEHCTSMHPSSVKFSLRSEKNSTGNWNAQVQLQHSGLPNQSGPWEVDMEQVTEQCKEFEYITIVANISGPSTQLIKLEHKLGPGYELIPGLGRYKFHSEVKTWFQARGICEEEGSHLLVINSQREANALLHFWTPHPKIGGYTDWKNDWAHIGFHDQYVEGEYVTIFGDHLNSTGYANWHPGQPNGHPGENCGCVQRKASLLADVPCTTELAFFCEKEL